MKTVRFLFAGGVAFLAACNSVERHASVQKQSLEALLAAVPVGTTHDLARTNLEARGWRITSDTTYTRNWPVKQEQPSLDSLITLDLPSRIGAPFRILVFGYLGMKDGKVVRHAVQVEANAL